MKRIVSYILFVAAATLVSSCKPELIAPEAAPSGEKSTFEFCVDFGTSDGPATKALTNAAQVKNLYVAVFDGAGYKLSEYVKADLVEPVAGANGTKYKYSVGLTVSSTKRILHFIANAPKKLSYGSESEVIGSLYTQLSNDDESTFQESYWQRIELDKIPAKPLPGEDDTDYLDIAAELNDINLVRNYSKIMLVSDAANLVVHGMWLVNCPDRGTIAPYNRNTGKFMTDYLRYTSVANIQGTDTGMGNYQGFMLATTKFLNPASFDSSTMISPEESGVDAGKLIGFVYEREKAIESPMYLILMAKYGTDTDDTYYKIALQDQKGEFYAMLRNFNYLIKIASVARRGEASAAAALASAPSGDISMNVEFNEINSISDGEARISVNETTMVLVGEKGEFIDLDDTIWYMYEPLNDGNTANGEYNETDGVGVTIDISEFGAAGPVLNGMTVHSGDDGGRRYIDILTNPITDVHLTQAISITGIRMNEGVPNTITRKINLILRKTLEMDLACGPNTDNGGNGHIVNGAGTPVTVTIGIEPDLPSSMFPMDFTIEAANRTLTPNGDVLPVKSGTSTILEKTDDTAWNTAAASYVGKPSFWYVKTISYEEYAAADLIDGKKYFTANFKANINASATDIYVSQPYFHQAKVSLLNYEASKFTGVSLSPSSMGVESGATFEFTLGAWETNPAREVTVGLARFEELSAAGYEKQLEYIRTDKEMINDVEVSFDIYRMTATQAANSISLKAFDKGAGYVKIWADRYDTETRSASIRSISSPYSAASIGITASNFTNTASGEPYAGQTFTTTLTATVLSGTTVSNAKVNGQNATANVSGTTLTITYQTSLNTSKIYDWPVTATLTYEGEEYPLSESTGLYVWSAPYYSRGDEITRRSNMTGIIIILNDRGNKYVYDNNGSSNSVKLGAVENPGTRIESQYVWEITNRNQPSDQSFITCQLQNLSTRKYVAVKNWGTEPTTTTTSTGGTMTINRVTVNSITYWEIMSTYNSANYYFNCWGEATSTNVGWYGTGASSDQGSRFRIYTAVYHDGYVRPTE